MSQLKISIDGEEFLFEDVSDEQKVEILRTLETIKQVGERGEQYLARLKRELGLANEDQ